MQPESVPELARQLGLDPDRIAFQAVSGGSIGRAYCLSSADRKLFVKCMDADEAAILKAECDGLTQLSKTGAIRTPEVVGLGEINAVAWLAMSWCDMQPVTDAGFVQLGTQLVKLHQHTSEQFGFDADNFIGRTPQPNRWDSDWSSFFLSQRLGPQLQRLDRHQADAFWERQLPALVESWERKFAGYQPQPSLLHGDLWSGNVAMTVSDEPLIFDPAVHYGDRECDLAMADLFGGFNDCFYQRYQALWPLEPDWAERRRYYQLYHLLNHANLFAGHYLQISKKLIGELSAV